MITYQQALSIIFETAITRLCPSVDTRIENSAGCFSSERVLSPEFVPPFDNSAMDGFALSSTLTQAASPAHPSRFKVIACIAAGDAPYQLGPEVSDFPTAVEIMTGAPLPSGPFDGVVKVEDVRIVRADDGSPLEILVTKPVQELENVRSRGQDFTIGQEVISAGTELMPQQIMSLASIGVDRIAVRGKPRVVVFSTGNELVHHSQKALAPGQIRNSTGPYLMATIPTCGAECDYRGTAPDHAEEFKIRLRQVLATAPDVILTTGAVSMGKFDFLLETLKEEGARVLFHKVAIRPGKPLLFAEFPGGSVLFGVPGNPVSTAVGLRFFVAPYLRALQGGMPETPIRARLVNTTSKPKGLRCFFKAHLGVSESGTHVQVLSGQASFMVSPLLEANAWVVLPEEGAEIPAGTVLDVYPLFPLPFSWSKAGLPNPGQDTIREGCCS